MASEVSQLSEMNSVLISSKEENERRRNEAAEKAAKISEVMHECQTMFYVLNAVVRSCTVLHTETPFRLCLLSTCCFILAGEATRRASRIHRAVPPNENFGH